MQLRRYKHLIRRKIGERAFCRNKRHNYQLTERLKYGEKKYLLIDPVVRASPKLHPFIKLWHASSKLPALSRNENIANAKKAQTSYTLMTRHSTRGYSQLGPKALNTIQPHDAVSLVSIFSAMYLITRIDLSEEFCCIVLCFA